MYFNSYALPLNKMDDEYTNISNDVLEIFTPALMTGLLRLSYTACLVMKMLKKDNNFHLQPYCLCYFSIWTLTHLQEKTGFVQE